MKAIIISEEAFDAAFKQAEFDLSQAIKNADDLHAASPSSRVNLEAALTRLRNRLIESEV